MPHIQTEQLSNVLHTLAAMPFLLVAIAAVAQILTYVV